MASEAGRFLGQRLDVKPKASSGAPGQWMAFPLKDEYVRRLRAHP